MKRTSIQLAAICLAAGTAVAQPYDIGQDINPFGCQTVWPSIGGRDTYHSRLQEAGVQWARFDLCWWSLVESQPGVYVWNGHELGHGLPWDTDDQLQDLQDLGIEPFPILCYSNPNYDGETGPYSDTGRTAYGNYCYEAAKRYKDLVTYWEIWNEPNLQQFWGRAPDPEDYAALVAVAAPRIREGNPNAVIAGGSTSGIDVQFLETTFQNGLLDHVDIVTIHPYRIQPPESIGNEIAVLKSKIDQYKPAGKEIAIWTGEWGYNSYWSEISELGQAKCLSRMMVTNLSLGIENSIWFTVNPFIHDDQTGQDSEFGILNRDFSRRPSYYALQTVNRELGAPVEHVDDPFSIQTSIPLTNFNAEVFRRGSDERYTLALWIERWPLYEARDSWSGYTVDVYLDVPEGTEAVAYDGISGNSAAIIPVYEGDRLKVRNVPVKDYPTFIQLTLDRRVAGDVSGDGEVTPLDAHTAFECFLDGCPGAAQPEEADFCADGTVTPWDAQAIFSTYLGETGVCP